MLFGDKIRLLREEKRLLQRQLAAALEIDTPMYSKIERGERRAKREHVIILAEILQTDFRELLILWLADNVSAVVAKEKEISCAALDIVKKEIERG